MHTRSSALAVLAALSAAASADPPPAAPAPAAPAAPAAFIDPDTGHVASPPRAVPDYDGRGNREHAHASKLLWIPRVVLFPLYAVNEFVLRRPLGAFVTFAERHHWANTVATLFTFGPENHDVIYPTALLDFGLLPSVGLQFTGKDVFAPDNVLRIHAATWGPKWLNVVAADRYSYDKGAASVEARFELMRREDLLYYGIGPDVTRDTKTRYGLQRLEGSVMYTRRLHDESALSLVSGFHRISFVDGTCCGDRSLDDAVGSGFVPPPPGYRDDYSAVFERVDVTLDSREPKPEPGTGVYFHAHGAPSFARSQGSWIDYGASAGGSIDLDGRQRVLMLELTADFVDPMQGGSVPFVELATTGLEHMQGFLPGWIRGRSIAVAELGYRWPVWANVDGQIRVSAGNAFDAHLGDFSPEKLRMSYDIGVRTSGVRDAGVELLFGLGTETFEQGGGVTSVRVTVGSRRGF